MKKNIKIYIGILFAGLASFTLTQAQSLVQGTKNQLTWGKHGINDTTLKLNYNTKVKPITLTAGLDHPNGIRFLVSFKGLNVAVNLMNITSIQSGLDEDGDLQDKYYAQVATHDFDRDGNPEIIIAIGDGLTDISVNIIQYNSPVNAEDAIRIENWRLVGAFQGQEKIYIDKNVITCPFGSQGLFDEYTWINGKFIKTN